MNPHFPPPDTGQPASEKSLHPKSVPVLALGFSGRHSAGRHYHQHVLLLECPSPRGRRRHNWPHAHQRRARDPDRVLGHGQPHAHRLPR